MRSRSRMLGRDKRKRRRRTLVFRKWIAMGMGCDRELPTVDQIRSRRRRVRVGVGVEMQGVNCADGAGGHWEDTLNAGAGAVKVVVGGPVRSEKWCSCSPEQRPKPESLNLGGHGKGEKSVESRAGIRLSPRPLSSKLSRNATFQYRQGKAKI